MEHAYGQLKGHWRCLLKRVDVSVIDVPELITARCVLHNVCEAKGDLLNDYWEEDIERVLSAQLSISNSQPCNNSIVIRNALTRHFSS